MLRTRSQTRYTCARTATVIDAVEGVIRGYVAIWGSPGERDAYDTWWDKARPANIGMEFVPYPLKYEHAQDGVIRFETIGSVDRIWMDDTGYAFEGHLDRSSPYFKRIVSELNAGELKTSSATGNHLASFYDDGAFRQWDLVELTLTKSPAESRMPSVQLLRSTHEAVQAVPQGDGELAIDPITNAQGEQTTMDLQQMISDALASGASAAEIIAALVAAGVSYEDIAAAAGQVQPPAVDVTTLADEPVKEDEEEETEPARSLNGMAAFRAELNKHKAAQDLQTAQSRISALEAAVKAQRNAPPAQDNSRSAHAPSNVSVGEARKFTRLSDTDMQFTYLTLRSKGIAPSSDFLLTLAGRTETAIKKEVPSVVDPAVRSLLSATRANEIMT